MYNRDQAEQQFINIRQIQGILDRIYSEAGTHGVYLVEDSGFLIVEAGELDIDKTALSALVAASFGAIEEIAKLLGEKHFTQLTQQADNRHLFISKAGERHILITVFGKETNLGLVKLYVEKAVIHLAALLDYEPPVLKKVSAPEPEIDESPDDLDEEFSTEVFDQFDDDQSDEEMADDEDIKAANVLNQGDSSVKAGDIVSEAETEVIDEDMDIADEIEAILHENLGLETSTEDPGVSEEGDETLILEEEDSSPDKDESPAEDDISTDELSQEAEDEIPETVGEKESAETVKESDKEEASLEAVEAVEDDTEDEVLTVDDHPADEEVPTSGKSVDEVSLDSGGQPTLIDDDFDLEEEVEEDLDPEISKLTEELKSEIAQLREESKKLEKELAQSSDEEHKEEEVEQPIETELTETLTEESSGEEEAEDEASDEESPDEEMPLEDDGEEGEEGSTLDGDEEEKPESQESDDETDRGKSSTEERAFPSWLDD